MNTGRLPEAVKGFIWTPWPMLTACDLDFDSAFQGRNCTCGDFLDLTYLTHFRHLEGFQNSRSSA